MPPRPHGHGAQISFDTTSSNWETLKIKRSSKGDVIWKFTHSYPESIQVLIGTQSKLDFGLLPK